MYEELSLLSGERVLWSGKPERRRLFDRSDVSAVPLFLSWLGFLVFWMVSADRGGVPRTFVLWAGLIAVVGLVQFLGQLVVRFIQLGSTRYAITDRRVIEIVEHPRHRRTERYLRYLQPPVLRATNPESLGSVAFGQFPGFRDMFRRNQREATIVLRDISQPRYVRDLIADAQARAAS